MDVSAAIFSLKLFPLSCKQASKSPKVILVNIKLKFIKLFQAADVALGEFACELTVCFPPTLPKTMVNMLCYTLLEYNREMKLKNDKGMGIREKTFAVGHPSSS